jgi:hypothetical protein
MSTSPSRLTRSAPAVAVCLLAVVLAVGHLGCRRSGDAAGGPQSEPAPQAQTPAPAAATAPSVKKVVDYPSETLGALEVASVGERPVDWYEVFQDGERAIAGNPPLLGSTVELPPGAYVADVNRTQREVTIVAGKKTVLRPGELVVEGEPSSAFWYPMQGGERRLSSNPPLLNRARALFPGTYEVFVYEGVTIGERALGEAEVRAGERTVVKK